MFSVAKVISLVVYLGLVLFVIVALAFGEGKEYSFKKLSQSKCQLTDDKGRVSLDKGATVELKHRKKPSNVYILMLSDKFLSYYVESSNGKKSMHTVPMSQVKYISSAADIFSDSWSEASEKACG